MALIWLLRPCAGRARAEWTAVKGVVGQSLLYPYVARDLLVRGNVTFKFLVGDSSSLYFVVDAVKAKVFFETPFDVYSEWESMPLLLKSLPLSVALTALMLNGGKLSKFLKMARNNECACGFGTCR